MESSLDQLVESVLGAPNTGLLPPCIESNNKACYRRSVVNNVQAQGQKQGL